MLALILGATAAHAQNVGIGFSNPQSKLSVNGNFAIGADYNLAAPINGAIIEGSVGIGSNTIPAGVKLLISDSANTGVIIESGGVPDLQLRNGSGTNRQSIIEMVDSTTTEGFQLAVDLNANNQNNFSIVDRTNNTVRFFINPAGYVGVGAIATPLAPLHVRGSNGGLNVSGTWTYFNYASATLTNQAVNGTTSATAIFEGPVWAFGSFISLNGTLTASDSRMKRVIDHSDSQKDLDLLRQIQVTDYTYIDQVNQGSDVQKKIIAQQVEKVLPAAVKKKTDFLPDIYATATRIEPVDGRYVITVPNAHHLKDGDKVRLILENGPEMYANVKPIDDKSFSISSDTSINSRVFVYGREHNDVRCVDYDAISMLNVSATQELAKRVEALEQENKRLANREASERAEIASLKDANEKLAAMASKLEVLEKAVTSIRQKSRDVRTVSLSQ